MPSFFQRKPRLVSGLAPVKKGIVRRAVGLGTKALGGLGGLAFLPMMDIKGSMNKHRAGMINATKGNGLIKTQSARSTALKNMLLARPRTTEAAIGATAGLGVGGGVHALHHRNARKEGLPSRGAVGSLAQGAVGGAGLSLGASALLQGLARRGLSVQLAKQLKDGKTIPELQQWASKVLVDNRATAASVTQRDAKNLAGAKLRSKAHSETPRYVTQQYKMVSQLDDYMGQVAYDMTSGKVTADQGKDLILRSMAAKKGIQDDIRRKLVALGTKKDWTDLPDIDDLGFMLRPHQIADDRLKTFLQSRLKKTKSEHGINHLESLDRSLSKGWRGSPKDKAGPMGDKAMRTFLNDYASQHSGLYGRWKPNSAPKQLDVLFPPSKKK